MSCQAAILSAVPPHAIFVFAELAAGADPLEAAAQLAAASHPDHLVVGLGSTFLAALGADIPGMRPFPALVGPGVSMPRTPSALVLRISGVDPGEVLHRERAVLAALSAFTVVDRVAGFMYGPSLDLTGYEDGTENPDTDDAPAVALLDGHGPGLDGGSVLAVQRWVHDLDAFGAMSRHAQDHTFGRERDGNAEIEDAPESAHVKRTAQEDFDPEAFLWRRSMPWRDQRGQGLVFVSFSATMDPFEAQCRRMVGEDDGIVDALFSFTRPVTGGAWWCPPVADGRLDLRACRPR
ncbi:MAG: Dyp-type peroxidase [Deltaproteobacteria bacterium]|nr:MAG: Dyp-type peroxidase [Deltaproteobacteria bacterium]